MVGAGDSAFRRDFQIFSRHHRQVGAVNPMNQTPPFRADHVGSILRSKSLKDARAKREKGETSAAAGRGGAMSEAAHAG